MNRAAIRESVRIWRRDALGLPLSEPAPADGLIEQCAKAAGIAPTVLTAGDPLLAGASAMLDREAGAIWIDGALSPAARAYAAAHEYAHLILHSSCAPTGFSGTNAPVLRQPEQIVEDYAPQQRREIDANVWAAELLLPEPLLRCLFLDEQLGADEIAGRLGLDEALVFAQMRAILLRLPPESANGLPVNSKLDADEGIAYAEPTLDPSQHAAATIEKGPFLLTAGPGTGKTRTLVARCAHLVHERGVLPESILALTFSRKAAAEMRERLIAAGVGTTTRGPWVGTFHAFCLEALRRYGDRVGLRDGWRLAGETDSFALLERNLMRLRLRELADLAIPTLHLRDILRAVSRAKDELCGPERYEELVAAHIDDGASGDGARRLREAARIYPIYQQILRESRRLDYGDLIFLTVELLQDCPDVRSKLAEQYPQIVADEYQDVNYASSRLLKLLAGEDAAGLWAVGDRRQSIYRFRGASPANVSLFHRDYPNGRTGELGRNYRSVPPIVRVFESAAAKLSAAEPGRFSGWQCARADSASEAPRVTAAVAGDPASQASGMAAQMRTLKGRGVAFGDQTVLCRSHAQAVQMADALIGQGIPVLYVGDLLERPEVKDLICLLELFSSRGAGGAAALLRAGRIFGDRNGAVFNWAQDAKIVSGIAGRSLAERVAAGFPDSRIGMALARIGARRDPLGVLDRFLFGDGRYLRRLYLQAQGDPLPVAVQLLAIRRLMELAGDSQAGFDREFSDRDDPEGEAAAPRIDSVAWFLREIRRYGIAGERLTASAGGRDDDEEAEIDAVRLMTVHAAKGLEFPAVFLPNLSDGKFPSRDRAPYIVEPRGLSGDRLIGDTAQDEEACLFFVALSRARDHLIVSRAERYSASGRTSEASPLLALIGDGLKSIGVGETRWSGSSQDEGMRPMERHPAVASLAGGDKPRFSASSLDLYRRCPRLYHYRTNLGLQEGGEAGGVYARYNGCVRAVSRWLQDEWATSGLPGEEALRERVGSVWAESAEKAGGGDLYDKLYLAQAIETLLLTRDSYAARAERESPMPDSTLTVELPNCTVLVGADLMTRGRDGVVRVVRERHGRVGDSDHTHPRLSLLRQGMERAFQGEAGRVELSYLRTGESRGVDAAPRYEPGRLRKYEEAAQGIIEGRFDPEPADAHQCATCPFHFVCPE